MSMFLKESQKDQVKFLIEELDQETLDENGFENVSEVANFMRSVVLPINEESQESMAKSAYGWISKVGKLGSKTRKAQNGMALWGMIAMGFMILGTMIGSLSRAGGGRAFGLVAMVIGTLTSLIFMVKHESDFDEAQTRLSAEARVVVPKITAMESKVKDPHLAAQLEKLKVDLTTELIDTEKDIARAGATKVVVNNNR